MGEEEGARVCENPDHRVCEAMCCLVGDWEWASGHGCHDELCDLGRVTNPKEPSTLICNLVIKISEPSDQPSVSAGCPPPVS